MAIEHDTVLNLIDLVKVAVTAVVSSGAVGGGALAIRSKQNTQMRVGLMRELDKRLNSLTQQVVEIKEQVKHLENSHNITQDLIVVHADYIKEGNAIAAELKSRIGTLESTVVRGEDLISKFNNTLERAKAGTLLEQPPVTGDVTFKEEKKP